VEMSKTAEKNEKARQQVNKLKLHIKKVGGCSRCGSTGVETMRNIGVGRNIEVHPRVWTPEYEPRGLWECGVMEEDGYFV